MLKFNALNPLTVAIMCLFVWSLESCAPESKLNRLSVADTTCISFSDSEIKQRFDLIGFNLDQYLSDEIIDNPTLYKMAKDGFGALGLKSLKAIQRIDRDIQANPVAA